jgi:hypothetical protein
MKTISIELDKKQFINILNNLNESDKLDIFNEVAVDNFLSKCEGTRGFFVISNCFMYIVNSLIYDVNLRLKIQNQFIKQLV